MIETKESTLRDLKESPGRKTYLLTRTDLELLARGYPVRAGLIVAADARLITAYFLPEREAMAMVFESRAFVPEVNTALSTIEALDLREIVVPEAAG